jgi:superfamily II helicase
LTDLESVINEDDLIPAQSNQPSHPSTHPNSTTSTNISVVTSIAPVATGSSQEHDDGTSLHASVAALQALKGLYDNQTAEFKSPEQARAVQLAMQGSEDILVILPTGAGKSVVFMAPAWAEKGKTTVVIVPFVALINEMEERCKELDLSCYIWGDSGTAPMAMAQVVLVSVHNAITPEFQQFLVRLEGSKKLARLVIDETHNVLTQRNFRGVMRRLPSCIRSIRVEIFTYHQMRRRAGFATYGNSHG